MLLIESGELHVDKVRLGSATSNVTDPQADLLALITNHKDNTMFICKCCTAPSVKYDTSRRPEVFKSPMSIHFCVSLGSSVIFS